MATVQECTELLKKFFDAVFQCDWDQAAKYQAELVVKEEVADGQKKDIRLHLPNSIFMPVSRADLLRLLRMQDEIANKTRRVKASTNPFLLDFKIMKMEVVNCYLMHLDHINLTCLALYKLYRQELDCMN